MIHVHIDPGAPVRAGVVHARGVDALSRPPELDAAIARAVDRRSGEPGPDDELVRRAVRDMLRNGRYKPTGRGKPASEYLLRYADVDVFPRINAPVDVCNAVSLDSLLPISVFDVDLAGTDRFVVRLGAPGETYVFNAGGQTIDLQDLVLGARVTDGAGRGEPIVNPVKDCQATKTHDGTSRVAAILYAPATGTDGPLESAVALFADLIGRCGSEVHVESAVLAPSESGRV